MSEFTNNPDPQAIPPSSEAEVPNEPQPKKNGWKTALAATGLLVAVGAALHCVLPKKSKTSETSEE